MATTPTQAASSSCRNRSYVRDLIHTFPMGISDAGLLMTCQELQGALEKATEAKESIALSIQTVGELLEYASMGDGGHLPSDLCLNVGSLLRVLGELSQGFGGATDNLQFLISQSDSRRLS